MHQNTRPDNTAVANRESSADQSREGGDGKSESDKFEEQEIREKSAASAQIVYKAIVKEGDEELARRHWRWLGAGWRPGWQWDFRW